MAIAVYLFRLGLWPVLRRLTSPWQALWSLLSGRDRYVLNLSDRPPISLHISPLNFLNLLRLIQAGYKPLSIDPQSHTILLEIAPGITFMARLANSGDLVTLRELLIDGDYGTSFAGFKILDIGAYTGDTAIFFCLRGAARVVAAEPAPDNYELARHNLSNFPLKERIELLPVAISAQRGKLTLYSHPSTPGCHTLYQRSSPPGKTAHTCVVEVWSFDDLVAHCGWEKIDLVKMDCEGAEYAILLEAPDHTLQKVQRWAIEYHGPPEPIENRLSSLGYQVERLKDWGTFGIIHACKR